MTDVVQDASTFATAVDAGEHAVEPLDENDEGTAKWAAKELKDLMLSMMDGCDKATKQQTLQFDVFREQMAQTATSAEGRGG